MVERDVVFAIGAALVSAGLTLAIRRFALKRSVALAAPRDRDVHTAVVPRLGGVAVAMSFLIATLVMALAAPDLLDFVPQRWLGIDRNLMGIWIGVLIVLISGMYDDIKGLNPWIKLLTHIAAGVALALSGVLIFHITNPFGSPILLGGLAAAFVVGWVVVMINAINWIDGLDGLAGGIGLIASVILYFLAIQPEVHQPSMAILAAILVGALVGFLPFNIYPAKIFLGDSGSQVLGFLLAVFAIISGGKLATALLVLGVPIMDTAWVIARRLIAKQPVYRADKLHIHHRLLAVGLSQKQAVLSLYAIAALFGIIALNTKSLGKFWALVLLIGLMVGVGASLVILAKRKEKHGAP